MLALVLRLFISFSFFILHGISFYAREQAIQTFNNRDFYFLFDPGLIFSTHFIHLFGQESAIHRNLNRFLLFYPYLKAFISTIEIYSQIITSWIRLV